MKISGRFTLVQTERPSALFSIQQPFAKICESQQPTVRVESAACATLKDLQLFVECTPTTWDDNGTIWDPELLVPEAGFYDIANATNASGSILFGPASGAVHGGSKFVLDGAYIIVSTEDTGSIQKYATATPYSYVGSTLVQSKTVTGDIENKTGIDVSPDGMYLFVVRFDTNKLYRYTFGTAFDLDTLSTTPDETLDTTTITVWRPASISWSQDGMNCVVSFYNRLSLLGGMIQQLDAISPFQLTGLVAGVSLNLGRNVNQAAYYANETKLLVSTVYHCTTPASNSVVSLRSYDLSVAGDFGAGATPTGCLTFSLPAAYNPSTKAIATTIDGFWLRVSSNGYRRFDIPYTITQEAVWDTVAGTVWDYSCTNLPFNAPPDTPTITTGSITATTVTLSGNTFFDMNAEDTHRASQWQVDISAGDYSSPVVDSGEDQSSLTSYAVSGLTSATQYKARARYQDDGRKWSAWSDSVTFTTA